MHLSITMSETLENFVSCRWFGGIPLSAPTLSFNAPPVTTEAAKTQLATSKAERVLILPSLVIKR